MTWFDRSTTTVRIPTQRRGRHETPLVIVVPEQLTWRQRLAMALGRAAWKRRRGIGLLLACLLCLPATAIAHVLAPGLWLALATLAAAGPAWLLWTHRQWPTDDPRVQAWRYGIAAAVLVTGAWAAASVAFGPFTQPLPLVWLLLTITALVTRRRLRTATRTPEPTDAGEGVEKESAR
ncbi:hypothetical protein [Streptomyces sp. UNOB3_S3]|uniref:hypothetical protein n=1 Tax=Streptomyces sp. UNOB3_S3 TaxID=2871682 RepID=UPI001E5E6AD4|nr:hypothetical protein [Streptomyces sp. UNOB3_S3]MCC3775344.1 hypothetical protein [Streptomyces sp. UNOB3_S3]